MSQRCHEHIQEVRCHIVVAIRKLAGSDQKEVEIGHIGIDSRRRTAGSGHMTEAGSDQMESGSDRKAQRVVRDILDSDRTGSDHIAAVVLEAEVEGVYCSLEKELGYMVAGAGRTEDIEKAGRVAVEIGHREQEKNGRRCSADLVGEVATGRASWQKVVAVEAGQSRSPRRQGMLGSPTCFQSRRIRWTKDATKRSREARKRTNTHLRLVGLVLRLAGLVFRCQRQPTDPSSSKLGGAASCPLSRENSHSHLASVRLAAAAVAGMKLEAVLHRMLRQGERRPELLRACLPNCNRNISAFCYVHDVPCNIRGVRVARVALLGILLTPC